MTTHHDHVGAATTRPVDNMDRRNWLADRWLIGGIYAAIVLIVVPLLLVKSLALLTWLPLLMALGPFAAGLWHPIASMIEARRPSPHQTVEHGQSPLKWMMLSFVITALVGIGAFLMIIAGSANWTSYSILTFGGIWTYILFGLPPVIMYAWTIQRLLAQRVFIGTIITSVVSLLAPWFWAGFMLYSQYHAL